MSNIQLIPYINFQGKAREAMEFYQRVLGGNLELQTLDEQGRPRPAGPGDVVMHSLLQAEGVFLIGVDGNPKYPAAAGDNMALTVHGTDKARLTEIFNRLSDGGRVKMPLTAQPWGATVGWLMDPFGINWTVSINEA